jgi:hypothetical protein
MTQNRIALKKIMQGTMTLSRIPQSIMALSIKRLTKKTLCRVSFGTMAFSE